MRPSLVRTLLLASLAASAAHLGAARAEVVELMPAKRASWSATNLFAPITGLFLGGPGYWYDRRQIEVETTPPGAFLDLFYIRGSFQQAYEQAESPVTVLLPSRVEATSRDSLMIRAVADGFQPKDVHVRVRSRETRISIDLAPLPNQLKAVAHHYLAGRGSLSFLTTESLSFRLQELDEGFSVILTQTAEAPELNGDLPDLESGLISGVQAQQLGSDLMVRVALQEGRREDTEIRSRQAHDAIRRLHIYTLDLVPQDGGAESVRRALEALERITARRVSGCALVFDDAMREQLDAAALARALNPSGSFLDRYLRAAMRRLGEVSPGGVVTLVDGSQYDTSVPIELAAASSEAGNVRGYIALLREFIEQLEARPQWRSTLRGVVAPELSPRAFDAVVDRAEERERECAA